MANPCEPLINVVNRNKPKVLRGLNQKGTWPEQGLIYLLSQTTRPPAKRRSLTKRRLQEPSARPEQG